MNPIVQWNPFSGLLDPASGAHSKNGSSVSAPWAPSVDVFETDNGYVFSVELAGVRKEDVNVKVENGVLVIHGQRKLENEQKIREWHRIEGSYGTFSRSFELPEGVDTESLDASFRDGLLTIKVAKAEKAKPRKIDVK